MAAKKAKPKARKPVAKKTATKRARAKKASPKKLAPRAAPKAKAKQPASKRSAPKRAAPSAKRAVHQLSVSRAEAPDRKAMLERALTDTPQPHERVAEKRAIWAETHAR